jgi:DNA-binding NtrC family response regulator
MPPQSQWGSYFASGIRPFIPARSISLGRPIFYLDDEASHLEVFHEMSGAEFDMCTSAAPDEARHMLAECAADIIISDEKMSKIKCTEFMRQAAKMCPESFSTLCYQSHSPS